MLLGLTEQRHRPARQKPKTLYRGSAIHGVRLRAPLARDATGIVTMWVFQRAGLFTVSASPGACAVQEL